MIRYITLPILSCVLFCQNDDRIINDKSIIGFTNFINLETAFRPHLNNSSNFGQYQKLSLGVGLNNGFKSNIFTYRNTFYYKLNNNLIADASYSISNIRGSQYSDKYGYELLNEINGNFDAGVRLYPLNNAFFNIDLRNYNSSNGNGSSIDLDFMGFTIKRLFKKGFIDDSH